MKKNTGSQYVAKTPDKSGYVNYTHAENEVWHDLYERQIKLVNGRACDAFLEGLQSLGLSKKNIPQLPDVNKRLGDVTGWQVEPVSALITAAEFFELLANKKFPAATFIRARQEFDYVKEPDIFHELFGHCPMLTNQPYADFMQKFAQTTLGFDKSDWRLLLRLFWFTVEFGLITTGQNELKIYGGGILSSPTETPYSIESHQPERKAFSLLEALRTPYRIDILQPIYYVIPSFEHLHALCKPDLLRESIAKARQHGEFPPLFDDTEGAFINIC